MTVVGEAPVLDLSSAKMGVNVSEREVQSLPVNGRQMSQLMLQAPGSQNAGKGTWQDIRFSGRAVEQNAIRYDGVEGSAIIDASPGNLNGEIADAVQAAGQPRERAGVPRRIERLPRRIRHRHGRPDQRHHQVGQQQFHGSLFEYLPERRPRRAELLRHSAPRWQRHAELPKSPLKHNQFGGSLGGPIMKNRASSSPATKAIGWTPASTSSRPSRAPRRGRAPSRGCGAAAGIHGAGRGAPAGRVDRMQTSTSPSCRRQQKVNEDAFSGRFDFKVSNSWSSYVRVSHDQGTNDQPESVAGRVLHMTDNPTNAVFNLQGVLCGSTINEFKFGYNARADRRSTASRPVINGIDFNAISSTSRGSVANSGIAGQGTSSVSPSRAAWCAPTARPTAAASRTTPTRSRSPTR